MHWLIEKILKKRKIEDIKDLDSEETETFDKWQKILTTEKITIENMEALLEDLKQKAIREIGEPDNSDKKDAKCKATITICDALLGLISAPMAEKENLVKYLEELLKE